MKQTYKIKPNDLPKINKLANITGDELLYLLKRLGITHRTYGMMIEPPITTGAGMIYYRLKKKIPVRLITPLIEKYPPTFLEELLKSRYEEKGKN